MENNKTWPKKVREILAKRDKDQQWLAAELNETPAWLSHRMTGRTRCSIQELEAMAKALNVTATEIISTDTSLSAQVEQEVSSIMSEMTTDEIDRALNILRALKN